MLKTNSKIARNNVKQFILENCTDYDGNNFETLNQCCVYIYNTFVSEYYATDNRRYMHSKEFFFNEWVQGVPTGHLFNYYLGKENYNAIDIVGNILQETEEEKSRYSEEDACTLLTYLIYREVERVIYKINEGVKI